MNTTSVLINLDLEFKSVQTLLDVVVKVDDTILLQGTRHTPVQTISVELDLVPGSHALTIELLNKNYDECSAENDAAVIIHGVRFQHLPNDFKHYSWYRPNYPTHWTGDEVVHANYLGWNGIWGINFDSPIYPWIHKQLNLGWLV